MLLAFCCAGLVVADEADETAPGKQGPNKPRPNVTLKELLDKPGTVKVEVATDPPKASVGKHWIGVECDVAPPALRAQLGLKDKSGLVVVAVAPESPAQKAGLADHDLLLTANSIKLGGVHDLMKAIHAADGKAITLKLLRGGKEKTIEVQPAERPRDTTKFFERALPAGEDRDIIMKWFQADGTPGERGELPPIIKFARPTAGVLMQPGKVFRPPLPDDVTVTIERSGNKPAKITVKRGDEQWEVTDEQIDKLPKDLRMQLLPLGMGLGIQMPAFSAIQVQPLPAKEDLAAAAARAKRIAAGVEAVQPGVGARFQIVAPGQETVGGKGAKIVVGSTQPQASIGQQLDEINRRLERIEKAILGKQNESK